MGFRGVLRQLSDWKNPIIVFLLPIVLLPIPLHGQSNVARCAYAVIIIGTFWVTEVMPIAVTSLIPVFLFPVLGIMPATDVCSYYANDTLMLFFGSLVVAVAVERWDLHKRIALRALTLVGPEPRWLMLGIMLPTWFLSMWMSNTATTAMMIPILNAILTQIRAVREKVEDSEDEKEVGETTLCLKGDSHDVIQNGGPDVKANGFLPHDDTSIEIEFEMDDLLDLENPIRFTESDLKTMPKHVDKDKEFDQLSKTFALCTAYAANAGGIATLTGTPPNIIFKGQADIKFNDYGAESGVNFGNWMVAGVPLSLLVFIVTWVWMQIYCLKSKCLCCIKQENSYALVKVHLQNEYKKLGSMTFAEWVVLTDLIVLAFLWIARDPQFIPGWATLFPTSYVRDSTAAILMSVILFVLPSQMPSFLRRKVAEVDYEVGEFSSREKVMQREEMEVKNYVPLLNWKIVNEKMAWGVLILMGGGFALAEGCSRSGLSEWMSDQLTVLRHLAPWAIAAILSYMVAIITNITSNAATATLFLPVVAELGIKLGINPLYFMIPVAVSASFAYLLPVGTPPNAIVFSTGYLKIADMIKAGFAINFLAVLILQFALNSFIRPIFDLDVLQDAFKKPLLNTTEVLLNVTENIPYDLASSLS